MCSFSSSAVGGCKVEARENVTGGEKRARERVRRGRDGGDEPVSEEGAGGGGDGGEISFHNDPKRLSDALPRLLRGELHYGTCFGH